MTFKNASLAAAAAFIAIGASAHAADMPMAPPPVQALVPEATSFDWSGFYVGVYGGYAFGESDDASIGVADADGGLAGGTVGYQIQSGNFVYGIEADGGWAGIETDNDPDFETTIDWTSTVRGRIGYAFDNFLLFATGGAAIAGVEHTVFGVGTEDDTRLGWTVGAGMEAALTDNISGKIEYQYLDLGDDTLVGGDVDLNAHTVKAGINYRF